MADGDRRGCGLDPVTRSPLMALNAACTPFRGNRNTASICSAVSLRVPARTITNAVAMLNGEITKFLPGSALTRYRSYPNAVMPSTVASTGASGGGASRSTPTARSTDTSAGAELGAAVPHAATKMATTAPARSISTLPKRPMHKPTTHLRGFDVTPAKPVPCTRHVGDVDVRAPRYFGGRLRANATPRSIQRRRSASSATPSASTDEPPLHRPARQIERPGTRLRQQRVLL